VQVAELYTRMPDAPRTRLERVGHRGSPRERRENTLEGFAVALDHGADAVELDVHTTADGIVVVHHDPDVQGKSIARMSGRDVAAIDLGGGTRIPTLQSVLELLGTRATAYIELKGANSEAATLSVARRCGSRYALHSFDHHAVARAARLAPDVPRGVLLDKDLPDTIDAMRTAHAMTAARDVWPHWSLVTAAFVSAARSLGVRVIPWTVNDAAAARRLRDYGVDAICTDDVRLLNGLS